MKNALQGMTLPTCDILVNGQKRKLYGKKSNKIYLHNGDNFQLKVFNPLQERIGVQLKMNGLQVDNDMLIINPGQEIIIERYIGTNKKLTFSSYEIDTTNMSESRVKEVTKAIEKNGELEVVFWNEKKSQPIYTTTTTNIPYTNPWNPYPETTTYVPPTWPVNICSTSWTGYTIQTNSNIGVVMPSQSNDIVINGNLRINGTIDVNNGQLYVSNAIMTTGKAGTTGFSGGSGTSGFSGVSGTSGTSGVPGIAGTRGLPHFTNCNYVDTMYDYSSQKLSKRIETGRIERGGNSNQHFTPISFDTGEPFYKIKFKLLPFSLKPVKKKLYDSETIKRVFNGDNSATYIRTESAIREYCKCGYRISRGKGAWNNCPMCGRKIKK